MAHLELTGVSEDGKRLLLTDETGAEHDVVIDQRLRSLLRQGEPLGQPARRMEKQMESNLRPRDIQARVRAGESVEQLAEAAGTSVERILVFARPVLAEREHVAQRAQRSSVRRRAGETPGGARTLGEAVEGRLRAMNLGPDVVEWDSWRREDGRWSLVGLFRTSDREGTAELTYDAPGNFVVPDNDDARWLVGDTVDRERPAPEPAPERAPQQAPGQAEQADDLSRARERRRTVVDPVDQELPYDELGADALQLVQEEPAVDPDAPTAEQPAVTDAGPDADPDEEPPARRPVRKSRGRASVPSWDEIMFGGGKQE